MSDLKAETEAMNEVAAQVAVESKRIGDTLAGLTKGTRVLAMGWTGDAHDAFAAKYGAWEQSLSTQRDALDAAADALHKSAAEYDQADRAVAKIWSL